MAKKKAKKASGKAGKAVARKTAPARRPAKSTKAKARPVTKKTARAAKPTKPAPAKRRPAPKARAKSKVTVAKKAKAPAAKSRPKGKASVPKRSITRAAKAAPMPPAPARLNRERRRLPEAEAEDFTSASQDDRLMSSARSGHDELRSELRKHTEASPELTAGDVDAKWQDAYAVGDEAPGGDNPTPDQDRVDDIGRALGVEYDDDEELMGGEEIADRDEHRWELDPASKEDEEI